MESSSAPLIDILIVGGMVYDGAGSPPVAADVAVDGDEIVAIGPALGSVYQAKRTIDAGGLAVAPGFIDIHTHSDLSVLVNPLMESSIHQGVTTEIVGNCGMCAAMLTDADLFSGERRWIERGGVVVDWKSFGEFLSRVEQHGTAVNMASLVGHGTIRKRVMGMDERAPTPEESAAMKALVVEAMEAGAVGLSTGLEYLPGGYADLDEITPLAEVARDAGGFYASHIRNEGDTLEESVAEAIAIGDRTGIRVQLSHHKAEDRVNWGKVKSTLKMMDDARARGLDVLTDQYPYIAFMTGLAVIILPKWALAGTLAEIAIRLSDPELRARVRTEILADPPAWDQLIIGTAKAHPEAQGKNLAEVAATKGQHPLDTALDLLIDEGGWVTSAYFALCEEDVETVLRDPHTMIGSDGVSTAPHGMLGEDRTHPRTYGTFPRVLGEYVRKRGILPLEEAVRRMTSLPAARIRLSLRGTLAVGMKADITVFDPQTVIDRAGFDDPHRFNLGIEYVVVNGQIAIDAGTQVEITPGKILRLQSGLVQ